MDIQKKVDVSQRAKKGTERRRGAEQVSPSPHSARKDPRFIDPNRLSVSTLSPDKSLRDSPSTLRRPPRFEASTVLGPSPGKGVTKGHIRRFSKSLEAKIAPVRRRLLFEPQPATIIDKTASKPEGSTDKQVRKDVEGLVADEDNNPFPSRRSKTSTPKELFRAYAAESGSSRTPVQGGSEFAGLGQTGLEVTKTNWRNLNLRSEDGHFKALPKDLLKSFREDFPEILMLHERYPWIVAVCPEGLPKITPPFAIGGAPVVYVESIDVFEAATHRDRLATGNPRRADPFPEKVDRFKCPPDETLLKWLAATPHAIGIEYQYDRLVFYLDKESEVDYPAKVAGIPSFYTLRRISETLDSYSQRLIQPISSAALRDDSSYWPNLHPSIMIDNGRNFCTSGVVVKRDDTGNSIHVTVSNHTFPQNQVDHCGNRVGTIKHRYPAYDIAVLEADQGVIYNNRDYFQAAIPTQLAPWNESFKGDWVECDSVTTGLQQFMIIGRVLGTGEAPNNSDEYVFTDDMVQLSNGVTFKAASAVGNLSLTASQTAKGMCGAPVVLMDGTCVGFFWLSDGLVHYFSTLDNFLESGWSLG